MHNYICALTFQGCCRAAGGSTQPQRDAPRCTNTSQAYTVHQNSESLPGSPLSCQFSFSVFFSFCSWINKVYIYIYLYIYAPPPTDVCIWWVGTVLTDAGDWGSWWSGRFAGRGPFYKPQSQNLSPLLKRYNPLEWRRGSPRRTSSSGNSSWWPWGRGWSRSSPRWRSPSWSSWPGPRGRLCPRPRWTPARWWWSALRRRLFPQEWWLDSPSSWWALSSPSRTCEEQRTHTHTHTHAHKSVTQVRKHMETFNYKLSIKQDNVSVTIVINLKQVRLYTF